ncbi:hypothetical protein Q5H93_19430 [Hymenobacter sp. ASUV-10]|uniref:Cell surface protein SprA n=1 Tax=Hymenobacter aranciens TaxID=3063996 RepID=A0ABT9BIT5_9BACT|nr:hypothetical protein [Hymenobacter sp. ASUV-10]MDO7876927.1 hypothetical protein [Hymenobacter sp. ASUV-10]
MIRRYRLCFPFVGLLIAALTMLAEPARAQQKPAALAETAPPSTRRCRYLRLTPGRDTTSFALTDSLTIVPSSVTANGRSVAYDPRTDRYQFLRNGDKIDSVLLCYRVLPLRLTAPRYRRPQSLIDSLDFGRRVFTMEDFSVKEQILSTPGISKTGNLARGISFGNTQNVFVNSALNLQLEGKLSDNIQLTAAISDQSVPFQPEGNTQSLQQFDRIYITLINPTWNLTAGDVVLRNKPDYFLRYYKNIQGAAAEANFGPPILGLGGGATQGVANNTFLQNGLVMTPGSTTAPSSLNPPAVSQPQLTDPNRPLGGTGGLGEKSETSAAVPGAAGAGAPLRSNTINSVFGKWRSSTTVAGGVAKGKFASIDIAPIENVQGPYRLTGPNGEQFIIVLANSEKVYLDGRLQTRGFDADYTIDYNLAEVTFTPRHLITRNSRLKVDFEYSDLNYARSLYAISHYQQQNRLSVRANFYQEADNPDNATNLNLNDTDRVVLRRAGNVGVAETAGGELGAYNRTVVQYNQDPVTKAFTYPPDSTRDVYNVRFTDVGQGLGDYELSTTELNVNGRVYSYVGPNLGRYRPVRRIPTPLLKRMVAGGVSFRVDSSTTVFVDAAGSRLERNRFSDAADQGSAVRVGYAMQDRRIRGIGLLKNYRLRSTLDYEYTTEKFAPIDRYRDIEFDRNWSTTSTTTGTTAREDNILNFSVGVVKDANNSFNYRLSRRFRPGEVNGLQHWLDGAQKLGNLELRGSLFLLNSEAGRFHSDWARGEATGRFVSGRIVPGYTYRFDKNRVQAARSDTVRSANYFDEHNVFIESRDSARTSFRLDYSYRRDQAPTAEQTALALRGEAQTWQGTLASRIGKTQDIRLLATYRDLAARDSARARTVLGQLSYNVGLLQNQIRSELTYSVATGREQKRDYSFLAVPAGQGTHYYVDTNGDGRQQKEEFFEAQTADAQFRTYIKVYLTTADYVLAFTNRLSYRLTTAAPRGWREAGGWKAAASRFATLTSITVDRRTTDTDLTSRLNPLSYDKESDQLLAFNQLFRNTLYFNRSNPIFGSELTLQQNQQKTLLSQGSDLRNFTTQSLLVRRTLSTTFTGRLTGTREIREAASTYLATRNYRLLLYTAQPEISYQPVTALRLTATYLHTTKRNTYAEDTTGTRGTFDELGLEARLSQVGKRTITATARYAGVTFVGEQNSVVGLEILNALRPGANYTWNLNVEQRLSNGLNITVAYDGRKANGVKIVHTGRMQVAVLF